MMYEVDPPPWPVCAVIVVLTFLILLCIISLCLRYICSCCFEKTMRNHSRHNVPNEFNDDNLFLERIILREGVGQHDEYVTLRTDSGRDSVNNDEQGRTTEGHNDDNRSSEETMEETNYVLARQSSLAVDDNLFKTERFLPLAAVYSTSINIPDINESIQQMETENIYDETEEEHKNVNTSPVQSGVVPPHITALLSQRLALKKVELATRDPVTPVYHLGPGKHVDTHTTEERRHSMVFENKASFSSQAAGLFQSLPRTKHSCRHDEGYLSPVVSNDSLDNTYTLPRTEINVELNDTPDIPYEPCDGWEGEMPVKPASTVPLVTVVSKDETSNDESSCIDSQQIYDEIPDPCYSRASAEYHIYDCVMDDLFHDDNSQSSKTVGSRSVSRFEDMTSLPDGTCEPCVLNPATESASSREVKLHGFNFEENPYSILDEKMPFLSDHSFDEIQKHHLLYRSDKCDEYVSELSSTASSSLPEATPELHIQARNDKTSNDNQLHITAKMVSKHFQSADPVLNGTTPTHSIVTDNTGDENLIDPKDSHRMLDGNVVLPTDNVLVSARKALRKVGARPSEQTAGEPGSYDEGVLDNNTTTLAKVQRNYHENVIKHASSTLKPISDVNRPTTASWKKPKPQVLQKPKNEDRGRLSLR